VTTFSGTAFAQSADDRAAADALFDAARRLMDEGNFDQACPKFRDSYELDPGVGTLLNLALCYKQAGRTASAWSVYREAAAAARAQGQDDRERLARDEATALEGSLVRLLIEVSADAASVEGLEIKRGNQVLKRTLWGVGLPVDPGEVTIVATAPGYVQRSATVKVEGDGKTITFKLEALVKEGGDAAAAPLPDGAAPAPTEDTRALARPEEAPSTTTSRGSSPWPWVLGGAGIALAGTGTVFAFLQQADYNASLEICADRTSACSQTEVDRHEKLKTSSQSKAIVAYAGWGLGGAALIGAGVWMFLEKSKTDTGLRLQPVVGVGSWGLSANGSF
jgi:serine/threonine-protein kinase